jgi:hypothetical protein
MQQGTCRLVLFIDFNVEESVNENSGNQYGELFLLHKPVSCLPKPHHPLTRYVI